MAIQQLFVVVVFFPFLDFFLALQGALCRVLYQWLLLFITLGKICGKVCGIEKYLSEAGGILKKRGITRNKNVIVTT